MNSNRRRNEGEGEFGSSGALRATGHSGHSSVSACVGLFPEFTASQCNQRYTRLQKLANAADRSRNCPQTGSRQDSYAISEDVGLFCSHKNLHLCSALVIDISY